MSEAMVLLKRDGPIAIVTLNRPAAGNAVDMHLARELERTVDAVSVDGDVRCVILTGAGKLFCGGGDVAAVAAAAQGAGTFLLDLAMAFHKSVEKLAAMPKPFVVLVNGPAAGAGLSLAISGDVVLAVRSSHFTAAYGSVGLTPDGGMTWYLPRVVGLRRAQEIILTNRRVTAEEAAAIGLVTRVVENDALLSEGIAAAKLLADGPIGAIAGARALLAEALESDLSTQLRAEAARISVAGGSEEGREGITAFVERRKPIFVQRTSR